MMALPEQNTKLFGPYLTKIMEGFLFNPFAKQC